MSANIFEEFSLAILQELGDPSSAHICTIPPRPKYSICHLPNTHGHKTLVLKLLTILLFHETSPGKHPIKYTWNDPGPEWSMVMELF